MSPDNVGNSIYRNTIAVDQRYQLLNGLDLPLVMENPAVLFDHCMVFPVQQTHDPSMFTQIHKLNFSIVTITPQSLPLFFLNISANDDVVVRKYLLHDMYHLIQYQILEQRDGLRPPFSCSQMLHQTMPWQYVYGLTVLSNG